MKPVYEMETREWTVFVEHRNGHLTDNDIARLYDELSNNGPIIAQWPDDNGWSVQMTVELWVNRSIGEALAVALNAIRGCFDTPDLEGTFGHPVEIHIHLANKDAK